MSNKKDLILYMHAGSGNHGCEAIASTLISMLKKEKEKVNNNYNLHLLTYRKHEDDAYTLKDACEIIKERSFDDHKLAHILYYGYRLLTKDRDSFVRFRYKEALKISAPLAISIGGDNYCYDSMLNDLFLANSVFNKKGTKTALVGCSIEPELINRKDIKEDLSKYHTIIARESITYNALVEAFGKNGEENKKEPFVYLASDPAFTLPVDTSLVKQDHSNSVGINLSPIAQESESSNGITMQSYKNLVMHILKDTDMSITLIPHVIWKGNDDRDPLKTIYDFCIEEGFKDRVTFIEDTDAEKLKGIISSCRFFVGARTHSTIAAYSTCVPTLVMGYSVKARGIAKDLFPDYELDNLVMQVQKLSDTSSLSNAFDWLVEHEDELRNHLKTIMPAYIEDAYNIAKIVDGII